MRAVSVRLERGNQSLARMVNEWNAIWPGLLRYDEAVQGDDSVLRTGHLSSAFVSHLINGERDGAHVSFDIRKRNCSLSRVPLSFN